MYQTKLSGNKLKALSTKVRSTWNTLNAIAAILRGSLAGASTAYMGGTKTYARRPAINIKSIMETSTELGDGTSVLLNFLMIGRWM